MEQYAPKQGDIIWISLDPQSGHEQSGRRPALVVAGAKALRLIPGMAVICPISNTGNGFPLHIPLDEESQNTTGYVLCEQAKTLDLIARQATYKDGVSVPVLSEVLEVLHSMLED